MASSNPNSSALLPGPQTTLAGPVGVPRRVQYPAAASRSSGRPATGPYVLPALAPASAWMSRG